jgi:hypothetical protein
VASLYASSQVHEIGYTLAMAGAMAALVQISVLPYVMRTFDNWKTYSFSMTLLPYAFTTMPLLNLLAQSGYDETTGAMTPGTSIAMWICIAITQILSRLGMMGYT